MKLGSLFDGIGGSLLCAVNNGIEPVWASEIEAFPIKVTKHHFPNVKHLGDITKINGAEIEPVDIIVGGSPCQDLSVAGKRKGMKHADFGDEETTRSGLYMEQIRIIKEMRLKHGADKPRFMVWENVPGAFSSNGGEDFRAVLEETARVADPTISIPRSVNGWANAGSILADGFSISWRTLDAQYWGVPQRRRRIYLVADFRGQSAPQILFERESMSGNPAESRSEGQGAAEDAERSTCFAIDHVITTGGHCTAQGPCVKEDGPMFTLKAGGAHAICYGISAYESNSMKSNNPHSGIYKADTARTIDQNGGNPACNQGGMMVVCYDMTHATDVIRESGEQTPTLQHRMGTGGNQVPVFVDPQRAVTSHSLETYHCESHEELASVLKARDWKDPQCVASGLMAKSEPAYGEDAAPPTGSGKSVRRLTPLECERLQGYPDGWTDIQGASDSARYKALGNSFAIPCADFVISGCKEVFELQRQCNESVTIESDNRRKEEGGQNG